MKELRLFLGYALVVFWPGARPPPHPQPPTIEERAPARWTPTEYQLYIEEARRDLDQQRADKRDIRTRAQLLLTTTLVLGGAIAASYSNGEHGTLGKLVYLLAAAFTGLAGLAAGGLITAQAPIGAPSLSNLLSAPVGEVERRLADEYAATRFEGSATIAALVTVLRDCVLALILGFIAFAAAHVWA